MSHVSHKLKNSFEGALAGGGDPATSPLYVFGPFLKLIVVAGVANVTFGASIWLVVLTVIVVSSVYRLVVNWVTDGSGSSGLNEEEFGSWAVKVDAGLTFVEYTLTFLVSVAALVTFLADRFPVLIQPLLGFSMRTWVAILLSIVTGVLVNRGPRMAARAFGPATAGALILLWVMVFVTIWKLGFQLPALDLRAFSAEYREFTFGGYVRILALMTGIEIFANLVAAYSGTPQQKSKRAFGSLVIIMGTTSIAMLIIGPAILQLADPANENVSVFTQTMDQLLPQPLAYLGTLVGIAVLMSAAAASAQGLQNLSLGLRYRHYFPARIGQRNPFDVADRPVWIQVALVSFCFLAFGTREETYLAIYAAGVFVLLSLTCWAVTKRLLRQLREKYSAARLFTLAGTIVAALLTSGATTLIFTERFSEGAWMYFLFIPVLYAGFTLTRSVMGTPSSMQDQLGRLYVGTYLLPAEREGLPEYETRLEKIAVPLDGSQLGESALPTAERLARACNGKLVLLSVEGKQQPDTTDGQSLAGERKDLEHYLHHHKDKLHETGLEVDFVLGSGPVAQGINALAQDVEADLIVMSTKAKSVVKRMLLGSVAYQLTKICRTPIMLLRPTEDWKSRISEFKRLLVPLDGSDNAERVLPYVRKLAAHFQSHVLLLAVPGKEEETAELQKYLDDVAKALHEKNVDAEARVTGTVAAKTILSVAESDGSDLILLSTMGHGTFARRMMIGIVAYHVVRSTPCPVLLVPVRRQQPQAKGISSAT
ncbi:MAG: universal stress protein [Acidobacteria bacterium]|nr:universal stress protein [Acidobacteriota bacterium]